jgi:hypothetical protein
MSATTDNVPPSDAPLDRSSKKKAASKSIKGGGGSSNGTITRFLKIESTVSGDKAADVSRNKTADSHCVSYTHVVSEDNKRVFTHSATKDSGHNAILHLFVPATSGGNAPSIENQPSTQPSDMGPLLCAIDSVHGSTASIESGIAADLAPMPYNHVDACVFERSRQCVYSSLDAPNADIGEVGGNMSNLGDVAHASYFMGGGGGSSSRAMPTQGPVDVSLGSAGGAGVVGGAGGASGGVGCLKQGVARLLSDFWQKSRNGEWPLNTTVHCHWCCHKFDSTPIGLPIKMSHDHELFHVIGCFCSFECACAYNFDSRESTNERLSRFTLLNNLATRVGTERVPVKPAPPRYTLDMFGGFMTIEQFRAKSSKYIIVNTAPMTSVVQHAEGLNEHDVHSDYRYVPLDDQRVNKYQEQLKLKRAKPLLGAKNTLEQSMKITITPKRTDSPPGGHQPPPETAY